MSIVPIITFKAGLCDVDQSTKPYKVKCQPRPGYIYLYSEDDLIHFCWRERSVPLDQPELDLVMVPTDGHFVPVDHKSSDPPSSKTNGRIFVLKFASSSQRHLFWLQSKPQGRSGDPTWFSPRDRKIGEIVDRLLQGEEVDVTRELASVRNSSNDDSRRDDDDETMEDIEGHGDPDSHHTGGGGGAGPDATGGDVRSEGEDAREGGADGARAASSAAAAVRNFLRSLEDPGSLQDVKDTRRLEVERGKVYPLLSDLLDSSTTVPMIRAASEEYLNKLLGYLPPIVLVLAQQGDDGVLIPYDPAGDATGAALAAMSLEQKKSVLEKVLRSPQFHQSLLSLSMALRDGGLSMIAEALGIKLENGGLVPGGSVSLGGGDAVEAFVEGVKKSVQEEQ